MLSMFVVVCLHKYQSTDLQVAGVLRLSAVCSMSVSTSEVCA
jgi:hypothetical protein